MNGEKSVIVIGAGPAGLSATLTLAESGHAVDGPSMHSIGSGALIDPPVAAL